MKNLEKGWGLEILDNITLEKEWITKFIQMDSKEGEVSYYYEVDTDCVYICRWGEEDMISGSKQPKFRTSYDFFNWFYSSQLSDQ